MSEFTDIQVKIILAVRRIFAIEGYEGVSMRRLAEVLGVVPSVIYYHFSNKQIMLRAMFDYCSSELGRQRAALPVVRGFEELLKQRIRFQFEHAESVVAILKFYLYFRSGFAKNTRGFVPVTAYLHIKEVLMIGVEEGELMAMDVDEQAKIITHAINGFVLEYFPEAPSGDELDDLVASVAKFIGRAVRA